jgi:uncharacterized protein (DUF885 family)
MKILEAWKHYKEALLRLPARDSFSLGTDGLNRILAVSLSGGKPAQDILEHAREAYGKTREKVRTLAGRIDSSKPWQQIIYEGLPPVSSESELLQLYRAEVQALRHFLCSQDIMTVPGEEKLAVLQTPSYLQSLRAAASYRAPLTGNTGEPGVFYITPGKEDLKLIAGHCPYLSAHETYPGHHILDHVRIHHSNPIRRQVESPLFYEGWASYAEQLLDEFGYIRDLRRQLVQLKRQLWRDLRAILDLELHMEKITLDGAARRIAGLGFSLQRARRQVQRFCLTPGYQLCYSLGMYEIMRLRQRFSAGLGTKRFHNALLDGGQIPFHQVEKRLEALVSDEKGA